MIPLIGDVYSTKIHIKGRRIVVMRDLGERKKGSFLKMGIKFQICKMKKFLGSDLQCEYT